MKTKNYNTLYGIEQYYIPNRENRTVEASSIYGSNVWYYREITVRNSFRAFAMVNLDTLQYILRCDPVDDDQYNEYHKFCEEYDNPEWIVLS